MKVARTNVKNATEDAMVAAATAVQAAWRMREHDDILEERKRRAMSERFRWSVAR